MPEAAPRLPIRLPEARKLRLGVIFQSNPMWGLKYTLSLLLSSPEMWSLENTYE